MELYILIMLNLDTQTLTHSKVLHPNLESLPIQRCSMCYRQVDSKKSFFSQWNEIKSLRRSIFTILVLGSTWFGWDMVSIILNLDGSTYLKWAIVGIFTVLFGWISSSFWTSVLGFLTLIQKNDALAIGHSAGKSIVSINPETKVALVMPVYNEDVPKIFAGLEVMYRSLQQTGQLDRFNFFILSDSNQEEIWKEEEAAWRKLCQKVEGFGRIFYRRRKIRIHKKSGNISDFCRRWGKLYKYMVPLDADSLMSGQLIMDIVKIMEDRQDVGILQTLPKGINQKSLIARINQFSSHLYGPLLAAGSHFWQLDESGFWGHNAIIRLEPFIRYCALPKPGGFGPFGGEILSHDFIEAALMRRAGWGVWLAYHLEGSYEEFPPNLLRELERDARWCRGNIQHLRLMFMKGFAFGHRLLFLNGNMFYFSAFLWFTLLVLMTFYATIDFFHTPQYFSVHHTLFPQWPIQHRELSLNLLVVTTFFLFFPKILSVMWTIGSGRSYLFGGPLCLIGSVVLETVSSIFLAPIRMLFHTWCVLINLVGGTSAWNKQSRHFRRTSFLEALKAHWIGSLIALVWAVIAFEINETLFLWISLVAIPLISAMMVSIVLSSPRLGIWLKSKGIFLSPVDVSPPQEAISLTHLCP